jgi:hypothetical protein
MAVLFVVAAAAVSHAGTTTFDYTTGIQDTMAASFWPKSNQGK